jgi:hypothetical protein
MKKMLGVRLVQQRVSQYECGIHRISAHSLGDSNERQFDKLTWRLQHNNCSASAKQSLDRGVVNWMCHPKVKCWQAAFYSKQRLETPKCSISASDCYKTELCSLTWTRHGS